MLSVVTLIVAKWEEKKKIKIGSTFCFVLLGIFGSHMHSTLPSHSAQLLRDSGILRQAAVESGSR